MSSLVLEFDEYHHSYHLDGIPIPSVTQVLQSVGIIDVSGLSDEVRVFALGRGTAVHEACRLLDKGNLDRASVDPAIAGHLAAYESFLADTKAKPLMIEERVVNEVLRYAGTLDRVYEIDGHKVIAEIKTSHVPRWAGAQLAAYAMCLDQAMRRIGIGLRQDGTYRIKTFQDPRDMEIFIASLAVHNWKTNGEK